MKQNETNLDIFFEFSHTPKKIHEHILICISTMYPESYYFSLIPLILLWSKLSLSLIWTIIKISLTTSLLLLLSYYCLISTRCQSSALKSLCTSSYVTPLINLPISLRVKAKTFLLAQKTLYNQVPQTAFQLLYFHSGMILPYRAFPIAVLPLWNNLAPDNPVAHSSISFGPLFKYNLFSDDVTLIAFNHQTHFKELKEKKS